MMRRKNTARPMPESRTVDPTINLSGTSSSHYQDIDHPLYSKENIGNNEKGGRVEFLCVSCAFGCMALLCYGFCIWLVCL